MKTSIFFTELFSISCLVFCSSICQSWTKFISNSTEPNLSCDEEELPCLSNQINQTYPRVTECISNQLRNRGINVCPEGSGVWQYNRNVSYGSCNVILQRYNNRSHCQGVGSPACNHSTCTVVPALSCSDFSCNISEVICTSQCDEKIKAGQKIFQCSDGGLIMESQFCDDTFDCLDGSDEMLGQPGHKRNLQSDCITPQRNFYNYNLEAERTLLEWFQCLDKKLVISKHQVCDRIFDCYDFSDECLCDHNFHSNFCCKIFCGNDPSRLACIGFQGNYSVASFQNRQKLKSNHDNFTECSSSKGNRISEFQDLSDECPCKASSKVCDVDCRQQTFNCNITRQDIRKYINETACRRALEGERQRVTCGLVCKAAYFLTVKKSTEGDDFETYEYESNEQSCMLKVKRRRETKIASRDHLIKSTPIRILFWIMAFFIFIGNFHVIYSTIGLLRKPMLPSFKVNHILILNLAVADFVMGIYLLGIAVKNFMLFGHYEEKDIEWRSSVLCSFLGGLAVISSETSCFLVALLTAFRLRNIYRPYTSETSSNLPWKLGISFSWVFSITIAYIPIMDITSTYFVNSVHLSDVFGKPFQSYTEFIQFACRIASLSNKTITSNDSSTWHAVKTFLREHFPQYLPIKEFGYYGETSVCLPDFYVDVDQQFWQYSVTIITLNFILFMFVAIGYICMYRNVMLHSREQHDVEETRMQRRIARLVLTDFLCWIPICSMAYIQLFGIRLGKEIYPITAGVLLPINSVFNPILYSRFVEDNLRTVFCCKKSRNER